MNQFKLMRNLCGLFWLTPFLTLSAAVYHCIDTTTPLKCTLSSNYHNRILVEKSMIKKVVSSDLDLSINMEPESGQVFVYSLNPNPKETALSVITKNGHVQDIEVDFVMGSPEVIILTEPLEQENDIKFEQPREKVVEMDAIVDAVFSGTVPFGYCPLEIEKVRSQVKKGLVVETVLLLRGSTEDVYVYQLINLTNKCQKITEKELSCEDSKWIFLETSVLKPQEAVRLIISYTKGKV